MFSPLSVIVNIAGLMVLTAVTKMTLVLPKDAKWSGAHRLNGMKTYVYYTSVNGSSVLSLDRHRTQLDFV